MYKISDTSTFSTFSVGPDAKAIKLVTNETYTLAAPGPVKDRQDAPHLHDAVLDPTKKFIMVPDLGSDLIRIYKITVSAGKATTQPAGTIKAIPGTGPRHCGFSVSATNKTFFYHVNELSNSITGYNVSYSEADAVPHFGRIFDFNIHGPNGTVPKGTKAAELVVSVRKAAQNSDVRLVANVTLCLSP